jgi:hypothetical protein
VRGSKASKAGDKPQTWHAEETSSLSRSGWQGGEEILELLVSPESLSGILLGAYGAENAAPIPVARSRLVVKNLPMTSPPRPTGTAPCDWSRRTRRPVT